MSQESLQKTEGQLREFYDREGWGQGSGGQSLDAELWEDLRPCAQDYVRACRLRVREVLPQKGDRLLDAASGPIQYPEYLEYSEGFAKRVCVDISERALKLAEQKLGARGEYVKASLLELPFADDSFDAVVSLHTIYHIEKDGQERAVRELIRVAKAGVPIVIVYSNPDRILARARRALSGKARALAGEHSGSEGRIYFHAHPHSWWKRFEDSCEVSLRPWRILTAADAKRLVPDNWLGRGMLKVAGLIEESLPVLATSWGAYPMIVLKKRR